MYYHKAALVSTVVCEHTHTILQVDRRTFITGAHLFISTCDQL